MQILCKKNHHQPTFHETTATNSHSQKTPHTLPFRASYGASFMSTSTEIDRVIKGFYCRRIAPHPRMVQLNPNCNCCDLKQFYVSVHPGDAATLVIEKLNQHGSRTWISNYINVTQWEAFPRPCPNFIEVVTFHIIDVRLINYLYPNPSFIFMVGMGGWGWGWVGGGEGGLGVDGMGVGGWGGGCQCWIYLDKYSLMSGDLKQSLETY